MNSKFFKLIFSLILLSAIFVFPAKALAKSYYYPKIVVDIYVNHDSTVKVEEHQTFNFEGEYHYSFRDLNYNGLDYISDVQVRDDSLGAYYTQSKNTSQNNSQNDGKFVVDSSSSGQKVTWYFTAMDQEKTFTLSYLMHGVLTYQKTWDELYYNAIFSDRGVLVDNAEVYVHLPSETDSANLKSALYTTAQSPKTGAQDNKTLYYTGDNLEAYTNFTIVAGWPKGIVEHHFNRTKVLQTVGIGVGILSVIIVFLLWFFKGKDSPGRGTIAPEFAPPDRKLPVALAGLLIDESVGTEEVVATMLSLAQKGYLHIHEEKKEGLLSSDNYHLEKKKEFAGLSEIEKKIGEDLFGESQEKTTKDLKNKFYKKNVIFLCRFRNSF
jgi:hypothetical protein